MGLLTENEFVHGIADKKIPVLSRVFNATREILAKHVNKDFRMPSISRSFMSTADVELKGLYDFHRDGGMFKLVADLQISSVFNDIVHLRKPRKLWTVKIEVNPAYMRILPEINHKGEYILRPELSFMGDKQRYIVYENLRRDEVKNLFDIWEKTQVTPHEIMDTLKDDRNVFSSRETRDRKNAQRVMDNLGPMVPDGNRLARFDLNALSDFFKDKFEELRKEHENNRRLEAYTMVKESEVIPRKNGLEFRLFRVKGKHDLMEKFNVPKRPKFAFLPQEKGWAFGFFEPKQELGLFAKIDIPKGTWLGEYLGDDYTASNDDHTYVMFPDGSFSYDNIEKFGRKGKTLLKYSNDAPPEDMILEDGTRVKKANIYTDGFNMYAAADIRKGAELTWSYSGKAPWKPHNGMKAYTVEAIPQGPNEPSA